ncbi:LacI family DNA-binding transcriptional regulator [Rhizobium sp. FKL33]|uniref:LacI family DNA-binding transcriptional regulator n=1 Tax=Rhizobium sp. FKL33 TaxID=2562307 RepID=UPI0010C1289F|nr:LacI family DNA-binding transcriptional regulator [Rhizobium sp. FKL33]
MAHDFLIKDIAFQAGLSTATVDRVINGRGGVRRQTMSRVQAAIDELKQQEQAQALTGRTYVFDVIMETPDRFSTAVRQAFEQEAAISPPAVLRARFHFSERIEDAALVKLLARVRNRGSHGVVLKAADTPAVNQAVADLAKAGIPVVTIATDLPGSERIAYVGADNLAAGETAAYLIGSTLSEGAVLVTLSSSRFRGEEQRIEGFRGLLAARWPQLSIVEASEGYGRDAATGEIVRAALLQNADVNAVYSIGGGNRSILAAFDALGRTVECFVAHDLDEDNRHLLAEERVNFVLWHDLRRDAGSVFRAFLDWHKKIGPDQGPILSKLDVVTPFNAPV